MNNAVRASAASGIFYALAAGNGNPFTGEPLNACNTSPALVGRDPFGFPNGIITVGATGMDDDDASFSNFGPCVELWAPGVALESTWLLADGGMITASGTSFSSPMVAGAATLLRIVMALSIVVISTAENPSDVRRRAWSCSNAARCRQVHPAGMPALPASAA